MKIGLGIEAMQDRKRQNQVLAVQKYDSVLNLTGEVCVIEGISSEVEEQPCCEVEIGDLRVISLIDTGAAVSLIKREVVDKLPKGVIACRKPANSSVRDASGNSIGISSIVYIYFKMCQRKLLAPFYVLDGNAAWRQQILLGMNVLDSEKLIINLSKKRIEHTSGTYTKLLERDVATYFASNIFCNRKTFLKIKSVNRVVIQPYESMCVKAKNKNVRDEVCLVTPAKGVKAFLEESLVKSDRNGHLRVILCNEKMYQS